MNATKVSEIKIAIGDEAIENLVSHLSYRHREHARRALADALNHPLPLVYRPGNGFDYEAMWSPKDINVPGDSYMSNRLWLGTIKVICEVRRGVYTEQ